MTRKIIPKFLPCRCPMILRLSLTWNAHSRQCVSSSKSDTRVLVQPVITVFVEKVCDKRLTQLNLPIFQFFGKDEHSAAVIVSNVRAQGSEQHPHSHFQ